MKSVVIVCLYDRYAEEICIQLANLLNYHYLNVEQMIEYEIMDRVETQKKCGIDYLTRKEDSILKRVSSFEQTVFYPKYDIFVNANKKNLFEYKYVVYIKLTQKDLNHQLSCEYSQNANGELVINVLSYNERDKYLSAKSNFTLLSNERTPLEVAKDIFKCITGE